VNLAQDLSPGTASVLNDLVPEARLSRCFTDEFALSLWLVFTQSLQLRGPRDTQTLVASATPESPRGF
jgi:hypothetical protein